jgi:hypothetical protein
MLQQSLKAQTATAVTATALPNDTPRSPWAGPDRLFLYSFSSFKLALWILIDLWIDFCRWGGGDRWGIRSLWPLIISWRLICQICSSSSNLGSWLVFDVVISSNVRLFNTLVWRWILWRAPPADVVLVNTRSRYQQWATFAIFRALFGYGVCRCFFSLLSFHCMDVRRENTTMYSYFLRLFCILLLIYTSLCFRCETLSPFALLKSHGGKILFADLLWEKNTVPLKK